MHVALRGRGGEDLQHVVRGMGALELLDGRHRRVVGNQQPHDPLREQVIRDRVQALGAFGVALSHLVEQAVPVGDPGAGHCLFSSAIHRRRAARAVPCAASRAERYRNRLGGARRHNGSSILGRMPMKAAARLAAVLATALPLPCDAQAQPAYGCDSPESKRFDFWVGDWELSVRRRQEPQPHRRRPSTAA